MPRRAVLFPEADRHMGFTGRRKPAAMLPVGGLRRQPSQPAAPTHAGAVGQRKTVFGVFTFVAAILRMIRPCGPIGC